jgi:iron complex outermembrane receptor protein
LKWETTQSYGIGDFELFNNRLTGSVDYFQKIQGFNFSSTSSGNSQPGPPSPRFKNLPGNLLNKGFEVSLNYKVIDKEDFSWDVSGMLQVTKSLILQVLSYRRH